MKNQLPQICNNKTCKRFLFTLSLMLAGMMGIAQTAYISNSEDSIVMVIDVAKNAVIDTIKVGACPFGVAASLDGRKVYVTKLCDSTLSVINTATNTVSAAIPIGDHSSGVSVTPDGNKVYVTSGGSSNSKVSVINTAADTVIATIGFNDLNPRGVCVSPDGSKVYVVNSDSNTVSVINTFVDTVSASITVGPTACGPYAITVSPDGSKVYVTYSYDVYNIQLAEYIYYAGVSVIDAAKDTVVDTIPINMYGGSQSRGLTVSPDGSKLYATYIVGAGAGAVCVINTATDTVLATIPIGPDPVGISVTPDGSKVYAVNGGWNSVSVINSSTNTVVTTIQVGIQANSSPAAFGNFISLYSQPLGIASLSYDAASISIYPNPFTSQTTIGFSEEQKNTTITMTDLLGKEIKSIPHITGRQMVIDKGEMNNGIYFVQIMDEKGDVVNKKIVVQ